VGASRQPVDERVVSPAAIPTMPPRSAVLEKLGFERAGTADGS
jgi:hypothetical protein